MRLHVSAWSAWAPGVESPEAWRQWAESDAPGLAGAGIPAAGAAPTATPALPHLDAMFKRRLSQLSRMVLHVGHELAAGREIATVFASRHGEISQQYKISQNLIQEGEVKPAAFSLSVFNTPVALLSIAEKNHQRGSALDGGAASFTTALLEAAALTRRSAGDVLLLCGDESLPEAWQALAGLPLPPHALGLLVSASASPGCVGLEITAEGGLSEDWQAAGPGPTAAGLAQPLRFLAWFLSGCPGELRLAHRGFGLALRGVGP